MLFCCSWLGKYRIPRVLVGGKILCGCLLGKSWGKSWGFWLVGEVSKLDVLAGKVVAGFYQFISKKALICCGSLLGAQLVGGWKIFPLQGGAVQVIKL